MQQSDQLLITSLKDFIPISSNVETLSDIKGDEMFAIAISFLQALGIEVKQIKQIEKQKFRSTTKLNQKIHKQLEIQLELNDLLNPTTNFTRKTLLTFLSKLGSAQNQNDKPLVGKEQDAQKRKKKKIFTNWLEDQWIHPTLIQQSRPIYSAYLFPLTINRKTIKANLLPQLQNKKIKSNALSILTTSINHNLMKQRQTEQNTGITRKKIQQNANIQTGKLISSNFYDWNMAQQRLNKIKRKLQKDKQSAQAAKKAEEQQKMKQIVQKKQQIQIQSIFQAEVEQKIQEKEKEKQTAKQLTKTSQTSQSALSSIQSIQNPLERLQKEAEIKKNQYERMIQQLLVELNEKKQESQVVSQNKEKIENQIQKDEEKLIQFKSKTDQLKKQVEKKQLVLQAVQSPKQIQEEIKKFQEDIILIEQQVKEQVQNTTASISVIKVESDRKIQALKDLKIKLHRIQTEYKQICEQIDDKTERKGKIKIAKSGISRNYYSKRISEIDKRWRQTQKEVQKIKKDLQIMKEKTGIMTNAGDYIQKQIENLILADKSSKTQQQTKALKEIFTKCQSCYKTTLQTLNKINEIKEETRQYEIKVHSLTSQNYKQGIEKVNGALLEMKKQIQQMSKKQLVK